MAKVKRSVLKEIVKECLLEILFEGIDSEPGYEDEEPIREARQPSRTSRPSPRSLSSTKNKQVRANSKKRQKESHITEAVSSLTSDPVMASIYTDTAKTTLQDQRERRTPPSDGAAATVDSVENMEDLFEGANNWAAIAFNEVDN